MAFFSKPCLVLRPFWEGGKEETRRRGGGEEERRRRGGAEEERR